MAAAASAPAPFTLEAAPGTDIWRKPPGTNVWNAPIVRTSTGPLKSFLSARVTFWAPWLHLYDQAGLLLVPRRASLTTATAAAAVQPDHWVKTGVEFYADKPHLSAVSCDRFADWSLHPLSPGAGNDDDPSGPVNSVTIEVFRDGGAQGKNAWVHRVLLDGDGGVKDRIPLRKICWIFADEDDEGDGKWVLDVSPLVARPDKTALEPLRVDFKEFKVEWSSQQ